MRRSHWLAVAAVLLVVLSAAVLVGTRGEEAESSVLSRGAGGWMAARGYLEGRGISISLLDRPVGDDEAGRTLVVAFPWQRFEAPASLDKIERYVASGGTLVYAYSRSPHTPPEDELIERLRLATRRVRSTPPLHPLRWRAFVSEEWRLAADPGLGKNAQPVVTAAPHSVPLAPYSARVLYRGPDDVDAIFVFPFRRGRVFVLPADMLSNCRVSSPGNADLLESLARFTGPDLLVDEYHHGLSASVPAAAGHSRTVLDLLVMHMGFLYVLAVVALARRFGPAWREAPAIAGSTTALLQGLGSMHDRFKHHDEAVARLISRAREIDPQLSLPDALVPRTKTAGPRDLLRIANEIGQFPQKRSSRR
ncbi:MAG: DUF4350 domain-containing protein [Acidobacteriota bacterium]